MRTASRARDAVAPGPRRRLGRAAILLVLGVAAAAGVLARSAADGGHGVLDVQRDVPPAGDASDPAWDGPAFGDGGGGAAQRDGTLDDGDVAGAWRQLAVQPIEDRSGAAGVWTGTELVVWGGISRIERSTRATFLADGAAYDAGEDSWRLLAASPLAGREGAAAQWSGALLFIWGGQSSADLRSDGAVYDPAQDRWRVIGPSPLSPRMQSAVAWTGQEFVVIGGQDNGGPLRDAAAYDPERDVWRLLPEGPAELDGLAHPQAAWTGQHVLVWGNRGAGPPAPGVGYDAVRERWDVLPPHPSGSRFLQKATWSGDQLFAIMAGSGTARMSLAVLADDASSWTLLPDPPRLHPWSSAALWTDRGLVVLTTSELEPVSRHWLYDPQTQRWSELPGGPRFVAWEHVAVWTGDELLIWGPAAPTSGGVTAASFRFGDPVHGAD